MVTTVAPEASVWVVKPTENCGLLEFCGGGAATGVEENTRIEQPIAVATQVLPKRVFFMSPDSWNEMGWQTGFGLGRSPVLCSMKRPVFSKAIFQRRPQRALAGQKRSLG